MGGGGGAQSTSGAVIQQTAPWAAMAAGQYGYEAAQQAGQQATTAINDAITQMNQSYASAVSTLRPYTYQGVQAMDQLNQYLNLNPVSAGNAPTAPTAPTAPSINNPNALSAQLQGSNFVNQKGQTISGLQNILNQPSNKANVTQYQQALQAMGINPGTANVANPSAAQLSALQTSNPTLYNQFASAINGPANADYQAKQAAYNSQKSIYDQQLDQYNMTKGLQDQYSAAGPLTQQQITDQISNEPGYQAQLSQGIDAINKSSASKGYLGSGRVLKELNQYGQNTMSQYYGQKLSLLANQAAAGQQSATTVAGLQGQQGNSLASLYSNLGDTQANATLAGAGSLQNALTAANQQFSVMQTGSSSGGGGGLGGIGQLLGGAAGLLGTSTGGGGTIASALGFSSQTLKDKTVTPSTKEILSSVRQLDLDQWKYKGIDEEHIGPYAEQFKELFHVGNGQSINMIDVVGVLIGAVKELDKKLTALGAK